MTRIRAVFLAFVCIFVAAATLQAHPTSSSFVVVEIPGDGPVRVNVSADEAILEKMLEGLTGRSDRLETRSADVPALVELQIDGHRIDLTWNGIERTPN